MITLSNVYKSFNDGMKTVDVLKGIDLNISEGEMVALMGKSGSGKSTLINIIGGLIAPTSGSVFIDDKENDYTDSNALFKLRRAKVGFVLQDFALINRRTVLDNITFAVRTKEYREHKYAKVKDLLNEVGLEKKIGEYPFNLSNGEKQRVAIVRALVDNKKILLADEPTGSLDEYNSSLIIDIIRRRVKENKTTALIVTHDPDVAKKCDRILRIDYGKIVE
ncbi:MAG: ABC transporter ATP-binding protein [Lachnospiraceae bacterium]|jgi:putative ABC transport system ATP-binding protein|nr:ABC transporter ATP-binding protein [Lachnospiraceae bacterium]